MPPIARTFLDVAIAVTLTAAIVGVVIIFNGLLITPRASWSGFKLWTAFILRADILGIMVLTACVTAGYGIWQHRSR